MSIEPKAGIFKRWTIVVMAIVIPCGLAGTASLYLDNKYNDYRRADTAAEEAFEAFKDTSAEFAALKETP
jgi:hypothetical protein